MRQKVNNSVVHKGLCYDVECPPFIRDVFDVIVGGIDWGGDIEILQLLVFFFFVAIYEIYPFCLTSEPMNRKMQIKKIYVVLYFFWIHVGFNQITRNISNCVHSSYD